MNRFKRGICVVMAALLVLTFLPRAVWVTANAADASKLIYEIVDNTVTITGIYEEYYVEGELIIPEEIDGYPVTKIADGALQSCFKLTSIIIPNGVTEIGAYAFSDCSKLVSITIPPSVTSVGHLAFGVGGNSLEEVHITDLEAWLKIPFTSHSNPLENGAALVINGERFTEYVFPEGTTSVSRNFPFAGYKHLASVVIPNGVKTIENETFLNCTALTSVSLPAGLTKIGSGAFKNCIALKEIDIPQSVTSIGSEAFYQCTSLTNMTIPSGVKTIASETFQKCTSLSSVTIPEGVTTIEASAFRDCSALRSLVLPTSIDYIQSFAFYKCQSLAEITIPGSPEIYMSAFNLCPNLKKVNITDLEKWCAAYFMNLEAHPLGVAGGEVYLNGKPVTSLEITTNITSCAFEKVSSVTDVTFSDSVTTIGSCAFDSCTSLTSVTLSDSITTIGAYAFRDCTGLESITVPPNVTSIGNGAFAKTTVIYGDAGSYAETYANDNGYEFVSLTGTPDVPDEPEIPDEPSVPPVSIVLGDVNRDGTVDYDDAEKIVKYVIGEIGEEELDIGLADVDGDGAVTASDVYWVRKRAGGWSSPFEDITYFDGGDFPQRAFHFDYKLSPIDPYEMTVTIQCYYPEEPVNGQFRIVFPADRVELIPTYYSMFNYTAYGFCEDGVLNVAFVGANSGFTTTLRFRSEHLLTNPIELEIWVDRMVGVREVSNVHRQFVYTGGEEPAAKTTVLMPAYTITPPNKTEYLIGEELDLTGLSATATFGEDYTEEVRSNLTVSAFDSTSAGTKTVLVYCRNRAMGLFEVTVNSPYEYQFINDGTEAQIIGYVGTEDALTVPDTLGGVPVTSIGAEAFADMPIKAITLPNTVTHIGDRAFADCTQLTQIVLPASLNSIGNHVFYGSGINMIVYLGSAARWHAINAESKNDYANITLVTSAETKLGDVNGDTKIDSTDARLVLQYFVGSVEEKDLDLDNADVNGDTKVDSTDARLILQHFVGSITEFPAL